MTRASAVAIANDYTLAATARVHCDAESSRLERQLHQGARRTLTGRNCAGGDTSRPRSLTLGCLSRPWLECGGNWIGSLHGRPWDTKLPPVTCTSSAVNKEPSWPSDGTNGVRVMEACATAGIPLVVHFHGYDASARHVLEENKDNIEHCSGILPQSSLYRVR